MSGKGPEQTLIFHFSGATVTADLSSHVAVAGRKYCVEDIPRWPMRMRFGKCQNRAEPSLNQGPHVAKVPCWRIKMRARRSWSNCGTKLNQG